MVRDRGFDAEIGRLLHSLFERRNQADHATEGATSDDGARAIADAERFVDAVEEWLERHSD